MKKVFNYVGMLVLLLLLCIDIRTEAEAAGYNVVLVEGGYKFSLNYTQAIQGYVVDGEDIYIQQAYSKNNFAEFEDFQTGETENLVLISRCRYSPEADAYKPVDHMVLRDAGHGQTIEVYQHNGKKYLLVSCGSKSTSKKTLWWSTQIGRIEYRPGEFLDNHEIKRLTFLNYSNKKVERFGTTMRVDAMLSPDKKTLVIWKMNEKGQSEFSGYNFSAINKELDKAKGNEVNVKKNKKIKKAALFSTKAVRLSLKSFQGFAISNKVSGKYNLYVSSGDERYYEETGISIYKYEIKGSKIKHKSTVRLNADYLWSLFPQEEDNDETPDEETSEESSDEEIDYTEDDYEEDDDGIYAEVEDLKILEGHLQFVVRNTGDASQQILCTISKTEFR